ncbi:hypothetical protein HJC10_09355 [Corallococcus exiguus]|uniref:RDD family protein n=1 Tax=Corallococcus exiguus TaxID=83462 RepID=UPI00147105D1|nr:RDD family protein [Corallococcus exiguus]NNB96798.1 hypothetical protein [Corallococcus exiguus]NNC03052.1 hypothetical protein [Corallococcus exiguus]
MSDGTLFSMDTPPTEARFQNRLWVADALDLTGAALVGWGAVRAAEWVSTPALLGFAMGVAWVVLSCMGGLTGLTPGRHALGLKLERAEGRAPGLGAGLLRALTAPVELVLQVVLQHRPLDAQLGVHAAAIPGGIRGWARSLPLPLVELVLLAGALWSIVTPTRQEMLQYLDRTLTGWHCCHGTREATWQCRASLSRAVRNANGGDTEVSEFLRNECPVAATRIKP